MRRLHITNGDGAGTLLTQCGLGGDVLPWRDPMHHGPFPTGLDLDELASVRAEYLAGDRLDMAEIERDFRDRDARLRAAADHDEVVLWFEHDLLDQLQILQLLDWFSGAAFDLGKLTMICIDRSPALSRSGGWGS